MSLDLWQSAAFLAVPWCSHGITGRSGGESEGAFASLNLGLHVGDSPEVVLANRRWAAAALGFEAHDMVCAEQVHGGQVAIVDTSYRGRGAAALDTALPGVDALVTASPGVLLTLFYADCVPVLLADTRREVVAVMHAGWRGVVAQVVQNTVSAMRRDFGTKTSDLVAAIGPGIGVCCFEVGADVAAAFAPDFVHKGTGGTNPHVDLRSAIAYELEGIGVTRQRIQIAKACTFCQPHRYFSHRRDAGRTGRMAAMIGINHTTGKPSDGAL